MEENTLNETDFLAPEEEDKMTMPSDLDAKLDIKSEEYQTNWTRSATNALLDEYKNMRSYFGNPEYKLKDLWIILAKNLRAKGFQVSSSMCDRKFRNMKATFRTIFNSNRTEARKRSWEFYDKLLRLIEMQNKSFKRTQDWILKPLDGQINQNYIQIGSDNEEDTVPEYTDNFTSTIKKVEIKKPSPSSSKPKFSNIRRAPKILPPKWYSEFLQQYNRDQGNMKRTLRKIHIENKQMELQKIKLLEEVITLLKDKKDN